MNFNPSEPRFVPARSAVKVKLPMPEPRYWVEADRAVQNNAKLIGYGVWHINAAGGRECVQRFSANRNGRWEVALYLANTLCDDMNSQIE